MALERVNVLESARTEIVKDGDPMAIVEESLRQMRPDESRTACYQCSHEKAALPFIESECDLNDARDEATRFHHGGQPGIWMDSVPVGVTSTVTR
jgi:hypothetical protein